ncbi:MAG: B12-binding domain-containing radical SAM protein [Deltaproteobacteria bacterium]|nr:B12-binding domain-containing radical SAM protein [Deltaproteobacteria bacterium]
MKGKSVLLINPWIYDFAAYDLWAKPLGLLYLGGLLRENGCEIHLIDCLSRFHPFMHDKTPKSKVNGHGKYYREIVAKPSALATFPRNYGRYGISQEAFQYELSKLGQPEVVLVSSSMTYWYPGVFEVVRLVKEAWPGVPVVLGGIYASLCTSHARKYSGADYIITHEGEIKLLALLSQLWGTKPAYVPDMADLDTLPYPCFDLMEQVRYVCLQTSRGCPFRCTYCASHVLWQGLRRRNPAKVVAEIAFWISLTGVADFAFYDDALLYNPQDYAIPLLQAIVTKNIDARFHCPNGLHVRGISKEVASLMRQAGVVTLRLGLETSSPELQKASGAKVTNQEFHRAIQNLDSAGYDVKDVGVYILCGLPYQTIDEIQASVDLVKSEGARPMIVEYSPIPHTALWAEALQSSSYPIEAEPLFQNNSVLACQWEGLTYEMYLSLKRCIQNQG